MCKRSRKRCDAHDSRMLFLITSTTVSNPANNFFHFPTFFLCFLSADINTNKDPIVQFKALQHSQKPAHVSVCSHIFIRKENDFFSPSERADQIEIARLSLKARSLRSGLHEFEYVSLKRVIQPL